MQDVPKFVIVVPVTDNGRILLYRSKRGWELPGGKIEDETPEKAAIRELKEECGIEASIENLKYVGEIYDKGVKGVIYALKIDENTPIKRGAKLFKTLPSTLSYPAHETLAIIYAAITVLRKGESNGRS